MYLTNQRYRPESRHARSGHSSDMFQLTSEDMAGSSCGIARDQRLQEWWNQVSKYPSQAAQCASKEHRCT